MNSILFVPLDSIDRALSDWLPPTIRLVVWGVVAGLATMGLYALLSNQARLQIVKKDIKAVRVQLVNEDLTADQFRALLWQNLKLSFVLLKAVMLPAVLSGIPVLFVALWLSVNYAFLRVNPGETIDVDVMPKFVDIAIEPRSLGKTSGSGARILVPNAGQTVEFIEDGDTAFVWDPKDALTETVGKKQWWNWILENKAGYIRSDSRVEAIRFELQRAHYLDRVPSWMATWEFTFFLAVFGAALGTKLIFRIQ